MTDVPENPAPRPASEIASFHAHIYYDPATTRLEAERLRTWIDQRFSVTLGRWHDVKVGPHDQAMFQVAFAADVFPALVPWLMLAFWFIRTRRIRGGIILQIRFGLERLLPCMGTSCRTKMP